MFHLLPQYTPVTITDVTERNQQFLCEFVDLKRNGFRHYANALDNLTYYFWSPVLKEQIKTIDNFAETLKLTIKLK